MSLRLTRLLLVLLLVSGQVGGWLHAIGHYAGAPVVVDVDGGEAPDSDAEQAPCLVCLSYAALAVALLGRGLAFVPAGLSFARPTAVRRDPIFGRSYARSARGPPIFS